MEDILENEIKPFLTIKIILYCFVARLTFCYPNPVATEARPSPRISLHNRHAGNIATIIPFNACPVQIERAARCSKHSGRQYDASPTRCARARTPSYTPCYRYAENETFPAFGHRSPFRSTRCVCTVLLYWVVLMRRRPNTTLARKSIERVVSFTFARRTISRKQTKRWAFLRGKKKHDRATHNAYWTCDWACFCGYRMSNRMCEIAITYGRARIYNVRGWISKTLVARTFARFIYFAIMYTDNIQFVVLLNTVTFILLIRVIINIS